MLQLSRRHRIFHWPSPPTELWPTCFDIEVLPVPVARIRGASCWDAVATVDLVESGVWTLSESVVPYGQKTGAKIVCKALN
jgi:hypothetical protein